MTTERQPYKRQARDGYDMNLPEGKTCGDCVHFRRCNGIYGHIAGDEVCDWAPSRFLLSVTQSSRGGVTSQPCN